MQTKVSTKGQVVLPQPIRRRLGLRTGDHLEIEVRGGSIIMTPQRKAPGEVRIIRDPISGLPVISVGGDAPTLTSQQVEELLSDFP